MISASTDLPLEEADNLCVLLALVRDLTQLNFLVIISSVQRDFLEGRVVKKMKNAFFHL